MPATPRGDADSDLRRDNAELRRRLAEAEAALRKDGEHAEARAHAPAADPDALARARLAAIVESSSDAIYVYGFDGRVLSWNAGAEELFGYPAAEVLGRQVVVLVPPELHAEIDGIIATVREGVPIRNRQTIRMRRDGSRFDALLTASPVRDASGAPVAVSVIVRDISERTRVEQHLVFLADLSARFAALEGPDAIVRVAAEAIHRHLGLSRVNFSDVDLAAETITVFGGSRDEGLADDRVTHHLANYMPGALVRELAAGRSITIDDLATDPRTAAYADAYVQWNIRSLVMAPHLSDGRWKFLLVAHKGTAHAWRTDEVQLLRELTAHVHVRLERARAEQALREADRRKDEFLAMLAHELRNPLAPVRTAIGIMRTQGLVDPLHVRCHDIIDRQVTQMARLLDDLLDVSRLSRGKLTLQRSRVALQEVLEAAIETSRPLIEEQGHRLTVGPVDRDVVLDGDAARLTQVFANLLNNAARYSHPGGHIEISVRREAAGTVEVRVRDEGIGIRPELLPRVFDLFVQGRDAREHAAGGLGIGLSLARRLVEMHGGTIAVASEGRARGSEFTVSLPLAVEVEPASVPAAAVEPPVARQRVLVADDNVDAADTLALLLEARGCEAHAVYDGETAVSEADRLRPDVVLLDLGMPGVDGYEACRRIRSQPWGESMVIIAITGWGQDEDRRRSAAVGFDLHLVKPVDPKQLVRVIQDVAHRRAPARPS